MARAHPKPDHVRVRVLGASEITVGSRRVGMSTEALFALALFVTTRAGERLTRAEVLETFWPGSEEEARRHALRQMLYRLRQKGFRFAEEGEHLYLEAELVDSDVRACTSASWPESASAEAVEAAHKLYARGIFANVIVISSPELLLGILGEHDGYAHLREGLGIDGDLHAVAREISDDSELVGIAGHHGDTVVQAEAHDRPAKEVGPLCSPIHQEDPQARSSNGHHETGNPGTSSQIGTCAGSLGDCVDEAQGVGDHLAGADGTESANALGLAKDAEKPFVGMKIRHGRPPRG